jgi:poly(3-hydroxybutyrate) depolymerase
MSEKEQGGSRGRRALALLFTACAILAVLTWLPIRGFHRSALRLRNARGMPFRVVVFEPARASRPMPAIVVCQPVNSPPEAGQPLILEFARHGMLVVTFDTRGQTSEENRVLLRENVLAVTALDAAAVLGYLAARPDVDRSRVGLIGHSVGGTLAIRAGTEQPWVRATIAVGIAGDVTHALPQNLLWLVGLYDEFRPLLQMREVMQASNGDGVAQIGQTAGDFTQGTARRLEVIATADHFTEFLNHGTAVRALEWFQTAFNNRPAPPPRLAFAPWFFVFYAFAFLFGWLWLYQRACRSQAWPARRPRLFSLAITAVLLLLVFVPLPPLLFMRADLFLWLLALMLGVNAGLRAGRAAWLIPLGWASFLVTLVANQIAYFWHYPHLLLGLPALPFWHAAGVLGSYLFVYPRGLLFTNPDGAILRPGWFLVLLLALELARPGTVPAGVKCVIQRFQRRKAEGARPSPWLALLFVLLLFCVLGTILWLRAAQGFVDREALLLAGWVILRFALLPFFVFALLKRTLYARQASGMKSAGAATRVVPTAPL